MDWLAGGAEILADVRVARMEYLLPLKALAWKNLTTAKARGEAVDGDDIRKHKLRTPDLGRTQGSVNLIPIGRSWSDGCLDRRFLTR